MKKIITLFFALLLVSVAAIAQSNYEDVVYLKNGSIIHGIIIEQVPNVSIKIKSGDNVFFYKLEEVEKITKEEKQGGSGIGDFGFKPKGFTASYELGLTDIANGDDVAMLSVILIHGYQFNPHFSLGLGAGGEISSKKIYNVPVFLDARAYFLKSRATPYFALGAGYNLMIAEYASGYYDTETQATNGFMINPALGVRVALNQKVALGLNLGYKYIGTPVEVYNYFGSNTTELASFHCVTLRGGIVF